MPDAVENPEVSPSPFDFRKPCRLDLGIEQRITEWQRAACKLLPDKWAEYFSFAAELSPRKLETIQVDQHELPPDLQVFRLRFQGHPHVTLLGLPASLSLALMEGLLGGAPSAEPESRPLTAIESSLVEVVVQVLVEASNESSRSCGLPGCDLAGREASPHLIRVFSADEELVMLTLGIQMPYGESEFFWIWPEALANEMFPDGDSGPNKNNDELSRVAKRVKFQLAVRLGEAAIDLTELPSLNVGDVLMLNQRVSEPLQCWIRDKRIFDAWPGQQNSRLAIKVDQFID